MRASQQIGVRNLSIDRCAKITRQDAGAQGVDNQVDEALQVLSPLLYELHDLLNQHAAEWLKLSQPDRVKAVFRTLTREL